LKLKDKIRGSEILEKKPEEKKDDKK